MFKAALLTQYGTPVAILNCAAHFSSAIPVVIFIIFLTVDARIRGRKAVTVFRTPFTFTATEWDISSVVARSLVSL
jgi:hypothetical protein